VLRKRGRRARHAGRKRSPNCSVIARQWPPRGAGLPQAFIKLRPECDGTTTVVSLEPVEHTFGTRIEIEFGPAPPADDNPVYWAEISRRHDGSLLVIGELLGNRSAATLKRYNHLLDSPLKKPWNEAP
jgi:hypothetical protein